MMVLEYQELSQKLGPVITAIQDLNTTMGKIPLEIKLVPYNVQQSPSNFSRTGTYAPYATGDIISSPHMGLVGEAGPEAIIPLSESKRSRAMKLWKKTGQILGVSQHADGTIVVGTQGTQQAAGGKIDLGGIHIHLDGTQDAQSIMEAIKAQMPEIANELCETLYRIMGRTYRNMPV